MAQTRVLSQDEARPNRRHGPLALDLAERLPRIVLEARRVAATAVHGIHGRRRAGSGESFWQFRHLASGEPSNRIDWRRSAKDDQTYVRERELEAAHTIALWPDLSASMNFVSSLSQVPKIDRALVLALALAETLVEAGERVGFLGGPAASASRGIVERLAQILIENAGAMTGDLPPAIALPPLAEAILIGDALTEPDAFIAVMNAIASRGARGHLVVIADPAEESFPFNGHADIHDLELGAKLRVGNAEDFRGACLQRLTEYRAALQAGCRRLGWSFMLHRTDRPAAEAMLSVMGAVAAARRSMTG
jgi:uncharacterized protein (DUF58 family)